MESFLAALDHPIAAAAGEADDDGVAGLPLVDGLAVADDGAMMADARHIGAAGGDADLDVVVAAGAGMADVEDDVDRRRRRAAIAAAAMGIAVCRTDQEEADRQYQLRQDGVHAHEDSP